jgi:hypothetical protein
LSQINLSSITRQASCRRWAEILVPTPGAAAYSTVDMEERLRHGGEAQKQLLIEKGV